MDVLWGEIGEVKSYMNSKEQFKKDVIEGLQKPIKRLSSKYFYDEIGDEIFQEIMQLEEYYLPGCELEILQNQVGEMMGGFTHSAFDVIELGAGDGSKTVHFLRGLSSLGYDYTYVPLDISPDVLNTNEQNIKKLLPEAKVNPVPGDYFKTLQEIDPSIPKLIMFMGSNIGNFENGAAIDFIGHIKSFMNKGDRLMVGVDLKKNPITILAAYNDSKGVTKRFNLNILERINRELGGDFDTSFFEHYPFYNPITGSTYSFLISLKEQRVTIGESLIIFQEGEVIHTEVSQKYSFEQIEYIKSQLAFDKVIHYTDSKEYFSVSVFE